MRLRFLRGSLARRLLLFLCDLDLSDFFSLDVSDLATAGSSGYSGPDLVNLLIKAVNKLKFRNKGKIVIYCNRTVHTALELIAANKTNTHFTSKEVGGVDVLSFRGYPIRLCDAITDAEDRVV